MVNSKPLLLGAGAFALGTATLAWAAGDPGSLVIEDPYGDDWYAEQTDTFDESAAYEQLLPWPGFLSVEPRRGQWRVTTRLDRFEMPGMDDLGLMDALFNDPESNSDMVCVASVADIEDWVGSVAGEDCRVTTPQVDGDNFSFRFTCNDPSGERTRGTATGNATSTRSEVSLALELKSVDGMASELDMTFISERVGECE